MIALEFPATGSLSTRRFHGFEAGKSAHVGAFGTRRARAAPPLAARAATSIEAAAIRILNIAIGAYSPADERDRPERRRSAAAARGPPRRDAQETGGGRRPLLRRGGLVHRPHHRAWHRGHGDDADVPGAGRRLPLLRLPHLVAVDDARGPQPPHGPAA